MVRHVTSAAVFFVGSIVLWACGGNQLYWGAFKPTVPNFTEYFHEREAELDPIEGLWILDPYPEPSVFVDYFVAIARDGQESDYEYAALYVPRAPRSAARTSRFIFVRFRPTASDSIYEYAFTTEPWKGNVILKYDMLILPPGWRDPAHHTQVWVKSYP